MDNKALLEELIRKVIKEELSKEDIHHWLGLEIGRD